MKKQQQSVTELEGGVLSEIRARGACTAYQVRRMFAGSRSHEWSGSAGAVYPAIKRLTERGLIDAARDAEDARGTQLLRLTAEGEAAVRAWAADVGRAVGPGVDPFRTRSTEWDALPPAKRRALETKLERALEARIAELEHAIAADETGCGPRLELDLALQRSRLDWLRARRDGNG